MAATFATCGGASASLRHSHSSYASQGPRLATHAGRHLAGRSTRRYGAARAIHRSGWRFARARHGSERRLAARSTTDAAIRRYVGPASGYMPASTSVVATGGLQTGRASFYGGGRTASGGRVGSATCAHRSLPFGTRVLVTNLVNERQAILTVNDRGPFVRGRIVDVSVGAASVLGMLHSGTAPVSVQVVSGHG